MSYTFEVLAKANLVEGHNFDRVEFENGLGDIMSID
jgi:hypothetical protein